ncbi:Bacterial TSP3 repeat [Spirosomataceae bacterium]
MRQFTYISTTTNRAQTLAHNLSEILFYKKTKLKTPQWALAWLLFLSFAFLTIASNLRAQTCPNGQTIYSQYATTSSGGYLMGTLGSGAPNDMGAQIYDSGTSYQGIFTYADTFSGGTSINITGKYIDSRVDGILVAFSTDGTTWTTNSTLIGGFGSPTAAIYTTVNYTIPTSLTGAYKFIRVQGNSINTNLSIDAIQTSETECLAFNAATFFDNGDGGGTKNNCTKDGTESIGSPSGLFMNVLQGSTVVKSFPVTNGQAAISGLADGTYTLIITNSPTASVSVLTPEYSSGSPTKTVVISGGVLSSPVLPILFCLQILDTDDDGVPDWIDLDDDNDGILDSAEGCAPLVPPTNSLGRAEQQVPTGWVISNSSPDISDVTQHVYGAWSVGGCTGNAPAAPNGHTRWVSMGSSTGEAFKTTISGLLPGQPYTFTYYVAKFGIAKLAEHTLLMGGAIIDRYTPTVGCGWETRVVLFTPTQTSHDFEFKASITNYAPFLSTSVSVSADAISKLVCDTDNDGIPNSLDLDSDGDGCSDAIEGGAAFTAANLTSTKALSGAVSATGIPTLAGTGQAIGTSQNAGVQDANCPQPDFDGDGVPDSTDLDDDNDGVLDVKEQSCTLTSMSKTGITVTSSVNWTFQNAPTGLNALVDSTLVQQMYPTDVSLNGKTIFQFNLPSPKLLTLIELANNANQTPFIAGGTYKIQGSNDGGTTWIDIVASQVVANTAPILATTNSIKFDMPNNVNPYLAYRIYGISISGQANWAQEAYFGELVCTEFDTDNDGISNRLDLDSDGDGCNDAKESGTATSTTSTAGVVASPYGANGFANSLETTTDNGIYTGTYTYINAMSNTINACLDTDSDGIVDIIDLDDDNDGVLDVKEQSCTLTSMSKTGITVTSSVNWTFQNAPTGLNALVDGTLVQQIYPTDVSLNGKTIFQFNLPSPKLLTLIELANNANQTPFIAGGTYKIQGSNDGGTTWIDIVASQVVANTAPILATTNSIKFDMPNNVYPYLAYRIYGISISGQANWAQEAYFGELVCTEFDTDNDGISNRLDLDSDGDGCNDAKESGTATSTTSTAGVVASPYGTNGFANSLETTTDNGIYTGTYTYINAMSNTINACLDTDGDGIVDIIDLDDDNDGILDVIEMPSCNYVQVSNDDFGFLGINAAVTSTGTAPVTFGQGDGLGIPAVNIPGYTYTWDDGDRYTNDGAYAIVSNPRLSATFWFNENKDHTTELTGGGGGMLLINGSNPGTPAFTKSPTNLNIGQNYKLSTWVANILPSYNAGKLPNLTFNIKNANGAVIATFNTGDIAATYYLTWNKFELAFIPTTSTITFDIVSNSTPGGGNDYALDDIQLSVCNTFLDTDNDGIPNSLDLDSDGDGCPDAIEGGASFTTANLVTSTMAGGNSGAGYTGTSTSPVTQNLGNTVGSTTTTLGVPTSAGTGQTIGSSQNAGVQDANCPPPCVAGAAAPNLSATSISNVCPATTVNLTSITASNTPANTTLTWHSGTPATTANKITGTAVAAGTYYAAFFDATNNCYSGTSGSATTAVTVTITICCPTITNTTGNNVNPSACGTATGSVKICGLTANASGYTVNYDKNGTAATALTNQTADASGCITITGLTAGAYTNIKISSTACPAGSNALSATLTDPTGPSAPTGLAGVPSSGICVGTSVALSATGTTGATYTWTVSPTGATLASVAGTVSGTTASNTFNSTVAGTYTVSLTQTISGCTSAAATTTITVNATPSTVVPTATSKSNVCPTTTVDLTTLQPAAVSGVTYEWHTVASNPTSGTLVASAAAAASGTYYLYGKSASGCYSAASSAVTATVNACIPCTPVDPGIVSGSAASIKTGNTASFTLTGATAGTTTWAIFPSNGVSPNTGTGTSTGLVTFNIAGEYQVLFSTKNSNTPVGCSEPSFATATGQFTVEAPLSPCAKPSASSVGVSPASAAISEGATASFTMSGGTPNSSVQWVIIPSTGVSPSSGTGTSTGSVTFATKGLYTAVFSIVNLGDGSCAPVQQSSSAPIAVGLSPCSPPTSILVNSSTANQASNIGESVTFTATGGIPGVRTWTVTPATGANPSSGTGNTATITFTNGGIYSVVFTSKNSTIPLGCTQPVNTSASIIHNVSGDTDGDGVSDAQEAIDGTNPNDGCSYNAASQVLASTSAAWKALDCDNDGTPNGTDSQPKNPCVPNANSLACPTGDTDGDGVTNAQEAIDGTNPSNGCSYNVANQVYANTSAAWKALDCDNDGLTNGQEVDPNGDGSPGPNGTNPNNPDTDGDGVTDGAERTSSGTGDPLTNANDGCSYNQAEKTVTPSAAWAAADCDNDGTPNGTDAQPLNPCVPNANSLACPTGDTDGDGVTNGQEAIDGTNPSNGCSYNVASQVPANTSAAWKASDCDNDGNTNGTDPNPLVPVATNDMLTAPQGVTSSVNVLTNDDFLPGAGTSLTVISGGTATGTATFNPLTGMLSYVPAPGETGLVTLRYRVCNTVPNPDVCAEATVSITISASNAKLNLKVLLQGALLPTSSSGGPIMTGIMRDDLRTASPSQIPNLEPYTGLANSRFTHAGGGGETMGAGVLSAAGNDAIVDWVFVELRDKNNPATVLKTRSALVQRDGDVVESTDGISPLTFTGAVGESYYVSVKHRNHLGAMTAGAIAMTATGTLVDFTTMTAAQTYHLPGYDGFEQVDVNGKMALWAGNTNADKKVKYVGVGNDQIPVFGQAVNYVTNTTQQYNFDFATPVYLSGDINMDAKVKYRGPNNDTSFIFFNVITKYALLNTGALYNYDLFIEQLP